MRRLEKEIKNPNILLEILEDSQVCRIGFAVDNIPHIVPVNFGYKNNKVYIHSATEGSKIDMIAKNNYVCFEMELYDEVIKAKKSCGWTTKYRSIIGWGNIEIVNDKAKKVEGLDIIMAKYGKAENNDYSDAMLKKTALLVLTIDHYTGKQSGDWKSVPATLVAANFGG